MALLSSVYILAAFCIAGSFQTPFDKCSEGPPPLDLRVHGCENTPCPFVKGKNLTAEWDFTVLSNAAKLTPRIIARIFGSEVKYPFPEKDACKSLKNAECPLDEGEEVTYALQMPISKVYPSVQLSIEFGLVDENETVQVCFILEAEVVNAL